MSKINNVRQHKGEFGYLPRKRKRRIIITAIMLAVPC